MGLFFFLMGLCLLGAVLCEDKTTTVGGITVKVLGQSGKIKVYNGTEDNGIVLTFDGIYEKTSDGDKITGPTRHSFNNFAQLDFSFSDLEASTYPGTDLNVTQFNFSASIDVDPSNAKLVTYVYQFTEEGNITVDGNNVTVYPGDMKFNVKIDSWPFCGRNNVECPKGQNKDVGAFLDFDITVSGSVAPDNTTGQIAGSKVITPKEVTYNGSTTKDMPSGYPSTTVIDKKTTYTFRFEPFDSVLYDPIVSLDGANTEGGVTEEIKTVSYADVTAKLLGSSGKIEITSADNKVVVELDNLKEKDADDKDTTTSYQTFAGKAFTLNGPMDGTYPNTTISVQKITGEATMSNSAMVKLNLYVFKAGGNISNGNEYTIVRAGNVKFNLEISGWNFCNTTSQCNPGNFVGMYLDIDIVIKGKKNKATKKASAGNKGETFDLGDSTVILSKKVYVDDAPVPDDMVNGYPMHVTQGSKEIFRFRFPKFTNKVMYDPTFELGGSTGGAGSLSVTMTTLLIVATTILKMFF